jgi:hypothetical protein
MAFYGKVDYGQSAVSQSKPGRRISPSAAVIRSAMAQSIRHARRYGPEFISSGTAIHFPEPGYTAHNLRIKDSSLTGEVSGGLATHQG